MEAVGRHARTYAKDMLWRPFSDIDQRLDELVSVGRLAPERAEQLKLKLGHAMSGIPADMQTQMALSGEQVLPDSFQFPAMDSALDDIETAAKNIGGGGHSRVAAAADGLRLSVRFMHTAIGDPALARYVVEPAATEALGQ